MGKIFFLLILFSSAALAQKVDNLPALKQKQAYDNIIAQSMYDDSNVTSSVIWIKNEVKPHYHSRPHRTGAGNRR